MTIYERAAGLVHDGDVVGLGSGHAATAFIRLLGQRVQAGLRIRGVPTSLASAQVASEVGVPLVSLQEGMPLAITVDGADEVGAQPRPDQGLRARPRAREDRGSGVAPAGDPGRRQGSTGPWFTRQIAGRGGSLWRALVPGPLAGTGLEPVLYEEKEQVFFTDNGNHILDCGTGPLSEPAALEQRIRAIPGVVGTGLFLGMADLVLVGDDQFQLVAEKIRT